MQFTIAALSLLIAAGFSTAAPLEARQYTTTCPVVQEGDYVWNIDNFYARKPDGKKINSIGFNIKATNKGTLDFNCSASADVIEDGKFYSCGENSFMYFAYRQDRSGLLLRQDVSDECVPYPFLLQDDRLLTIRVVSNMSLPQHSRTTAALEAMVRTTSSARVYLLRTSLSFSTQASLSRL